MIARVVTLAGPADYTPDDVAATVAAARGTPVGVAVLPEAEWSNALADANFSTAALAGFTEMTRGLNNAHIDINSDPGAIRWTGTTPLEHVIVELARCRR